MGQNPASLPPLPRWDDCGVSYTVPCGPEDRTQFPAMGQACCTFPRFLPRFHFPTPHRGFLGPASKLPTCIYTLVSGSTFGRTQIKTICFVFLDTFPHLSKTPVKSFLEKALAKAKGGGGLISVDRYQAFLSGPIRALWMPLTRELPVGARFHCS